VTPPKGHLDRFLIPRVINDSQVNMRSHYDIKTNRLMVHEIDLEDRINGLIPRCQHAYGSP